MVLYCIMIRYLNRLSISVAPSDIINYIETERLGHIEGYVYAHRIDDKFAYPYRFLINEKWYYIIHSVDGVISTNLLRTVVDDDAIQNHVRCYEILCEKEYPIKVAIWGANELCDLNADIISVIKKYIYVEVIHSSLAA